MRGLCVSSPVELLKLPPHCLNIMRSKVEIVAISLDLLPWMHVIHLLISIAKGRKSFDLLLIILSSRLFSVTRLLKLTEVVLYLEALLLSRRRKDVRRRNRCG